MGERKVLNKYYPPDFDPAKIPCRRQPKNHQIKVRMMLPMSVRCATCGNYIYKGTKFNSRKEDVIGETYLGVQIFRFYFRCTKCSAEITFKTDPQNSDYVVESGATRNFEPWRAEDEEREKEKRKRDAEERGDALKSLENRTLDSKREMDILAALDEMKSMKRRQATISVDAVLEAWNCIKEEKPRSLEEEDRALFRKLKAQYERRIQEENAKRLEERLEEEDRALLRKLKEQHVRRIQDDFGASNDNCKRQKSNYVAPENPTDALTKASLVDSANKQDKAGGSRASKPTFTISVIKKRPPVSSGSKSAEQETSKAETKQNTTVSSSSLQLLCQQYGSDDDD